ncbi:MAG: helix-turn-helix transcriptional regulator [Sphingorhabdus sp.]
MSVKDLQELTEGQKACLRLVDDHHTSKEIARILGISPFTVDQRLDAARRKLSAESRKEAAKIFASFDKGISEPLVYEPQRLEHDPIADTTAKPAKPAARIFSNFASWISVPPIGGARHGLSTKEILVQSLNIAFFSTLVIAVVMLILTGMMGLFA